MTVPRAVQVQADSPLSYSDAIYKAICQASQAARENLRECACNGSGEGAYHVGLKVTLLVPEKP